MKINDEICINFPPHDIVINDEKDFESKVCIFPCHNKKKLFETIIRQNNIACCIQNIVNSSPDINSITDNFIQKVKKMPELSIATLTNLQKYVTELEIERGFINQTVLQKCLLMGEVWTC